MAVDFSAKGMLHRIADNFTYAFLPDARKGGFIKNIVYITCPYGQVFNP